MSIGCASIGLNISLIHIGPQPGDQALQQDRGTVSTGSFIPLISYSLVCNSFGIREVASTNLLTA
jgi:hypothetical protein